MGGLGTVQSTSVKSSSIKSSDEFDKGRCNPETLITKIIYALVTIWLFTKSDLKTIVVPSTLFAAVTATILVTPEYGKPLTKQTIVRSLPMTMTWIWINLLPFNIANQRQHDSILEDAQNKPWRPLPSGRISRETASLLMLCGYACAILFSVSHRGLPQCLGLLILGVWYNELRGADSGCIIRNCINACGYICFTSGALEVISSRSVLSMDPILQQWLLMIGAVVLTTIHAQDIPDQAGDKLRGRRTVPLVFGDTTARVALALAIGVWSCICPVFWGSGATSFSLTAGLGAITAVRFLVIGTVQADTHSFRMYNLWVMSIFMIPVHGVSAGARVR